MLSGIYSCSSFSSSSPDGPYLRIYLQPMQHTNANIRPIEGKGNLFANFSSMPMEMPRELGANTNSSSLEVIGEIIANVSHNETHVNSASSANISCRSRVEVYEGRDVMLTFVMEAYPPIRYQDWITPTHIHNSNNTVYQESYAAKGYRLARKALQSSMLIATDALLQTCQTKNNNLWFVKVVFLFLKFY